MIIPHALASCPQAKRLCDHKQRSPRNVASAAKVLAAQWSKVACHCPASSPAPSLVPGGHDQCILETLRNRRIHETLARFTFRCCPMRAKRVRRRTDGWWLALFSNLTDLATGQILANHFYKVHGAGCFFPLSFAETAAVRINCIAWSTLISTGLTLALGTMTVKPPN